VLGPAELARFATVACETMLVSPRQRLDDMRGSMLEYRNTGGGNSLRMKALCAQERLARWKGGTVWAGHSRYL